MYVNPEDWDVDFAFPNFNPASVTQLQFLKILTRIAIEAENELAEREVFPKRITAINERILRQ